MKRTKVQSASQPGYPTREPLGSPWGQRLALLGLLCLAPLPACNTVNHIDGLMAAPGEDWGAQLPAVGARTLHFLDGAVLDYHIDLVVTDGSLGGWVRDEELALLDLTDAHIEAWGSEDFALVADLRELEEEIVQALSDAFAGFEDASVVGFRDCTLLVDDFTPPGDGGEDTGDTG